MNEISAQISDPCSLAKVLIYSLQFEDEINKRDSLVLASILHEKLHSLNDLCEELNSNFEIT